MRSYVYRGLLILVVLLTAWAGSTAYKNHQISPVAEFGGMSLRLEYATSTAVQERGLGGRMRVPDDYGMLFVFPQDGIYGFWMKDMLVPIDIFWLNDKGQVVAMSQNVATSTYPNVFYPPAPVRYVLETSAGFAYAHAIATGTPLNLKN